MSDYPDYPYIRAWGEYLGSLPSNINLLVEEAQEDGAPHDAYTKLDGQWLTVDELAHPQARKALGLQPLTMTRVLAEAADLTNAGAQYLVGAFAAADPELLTRLLVQMRNNAAADPARMARHYHSHGR